MPFCEETSVIQRLSRSIDQMPQIHRQLVARYMEDHFKEIAVQLAAKRHVIIPALQEAGWTQPTDPMEIRLDNNGMTFGKLPKKNVSIAECYFG